MNEWCSKAIGSVWRWKKTIYNQFFRCWCLQVRNHLDFPCTVFVCNVSVEVCVCVGVGKITRDGWVYYIFGINCMANTPNSHTYNRRIRFDVRTNLSVSLWLIITFLLFFVSSFAFIIVLMLKFVRCCCSNFTDARVIEPQLLSEHHTCVLYVP